MKKKILSLILVLGLFLSGTILFTACGEPKIRNIYTKMDSDLSTYRNFGGFDYTTDTNQPAIQKLNQMSIVIEYSDNSKVEVGLDDSKVQSTITYDGNTIDSLPSVLDVGSYTIKYYYDNSSTYAEVYFFVGAGSIDYTITSQKNTWEYLAMPILVEEMRVPNYNGADSIVDFYYIDIPTYNQILSEDPDAFTTAFDVPDELEQNRIDGTTADKKIPVGNWYLFAYVPYTDQYKAYLTKPYAITVTKSELNSLVDDPYSPLTLTAKYTFDGSMLNDVSLSDITPEVIGNIYAHSSEYQDTWVLLELDGWANPNKTLNCSSEDKQAAVRFTFTSEQDARNYILTDAAYEQTIDVELQKGNVAHPDFAFAHGDKTTTSTTETEQKKDFVNYKLFYNSPIDIEDGDYGTDYYGDYFNIVEFYDVTNEGNAQKVNIYFEDGTIYKNNNYSGSIKVVLKEDNASYNPTVEIVNNTIGTYKLQLRLKNTINYEWGAQGQSYGVDNLTLTINITKNSVTDAMVVQANYVSVDKDGYGEITALVPKEYFENMPTSEDITLISQPYLGAQSNVTITDQSIVISDNEDNNYKIVIKNKYEFEKVAGSHYLCYKLTITTSDDYENIEQENQLVVLQFFINPGTDFSLTYIPKHIDHYATIDQQTIDNNTKKITIKETQNVKSLFGNLTSDYGTWTVQYEASSDSYQELTDSVALTSGNTLKIKLLYKINSELEELNTQLSHIVVGVSEINFTLIAQ